MDARRALAQGAGLGNALRSGPGISRPSSEEQLSIKESFVTRKKFKLI
jgi:hypothetical protein